MIRPRLLTGIVLTLALAAGPLATPLAQSGGGRKPEEPKLLGKCTPEQLSQEPYVEWYQKGFRYMPRPEIIEALRALDVSEERTGEGHRDRELFRNIPGGRDRGVVVRGVFEVELVGDEEPIENPAHRLDALIHGKRASGKTACPVTGCPASGCPSVPGRSSICSPLASVTQPSSVAP